MYIVLNCIFSELVYFIATFDLYLSSRLSVLWP